MIELNINHLCDSEDVQVLQSVCSSKSNNNDLNIMASLRNVSTK